jgi:hypothetical protein
MQSSVPLGSLLMLEQNATLILFYIFVICLNKALDMQLVQFEAFL